MWIISIKWIIFITLISLYNTRLQKNKTSISTLQINIKKVYKFYKSMIWLIINISGWEQYIIQVFYTLQIESQE